jgi:hypothetical protein
MSRFKEAKTAAILKTKMGRITLAILKQSLATMINSKSGVSLFVNTQLLGRCPFMSFLCKVAVASLQAHGSGSLL